MHEVLPELIEFDWAEAVEFILDALDLDPVALEKPDMDINTGNYGEYVGRLTWESLRPRDDSYATLHVFLDKARKKGNSWIELEELYSDIEHFDQIKQEYIDYIEGEIAKLMYLRKMKPELPNNIIFGPIQSFMTNKPVFSAEREARARRTNTFRIPVTANRVNNTNNTTRRNNANTTRRNNANKANNNRWAPNILQRGGPSKLIRKKKQTHRKKRPFRG